MAQRFGQHFLKSPKLLGEIAGYANITSSDVILEIGAGQGNLTQQLTKAKKVYAVEIDKFMIPKLIETTRGIPNIEIIHSDALKVEFPENVNKIIGNLPYEISGPITEKILRFLNKQKNNGIKNVLAVLMYQKEFADRMEAFPGLSNYSRLSVLCQYFSEVELLRSVPRTEFRPAPKIESMVVRLTPLGVKENEKLFYLTKIVFMHKNKTLLNALIDSREHLNIQDKSQLRDMIVPLIGELADKKVFYLEIEELELLAEKLKKLLPKNNS